MWITLGVMCINFLGDKLEQGKKNSEHIFLCNLLVDHKFGENGFKAGTYMDKMLIFH